MFICNSGQALLEGKSNRILGYKNGTYLDFDIDEIFKIQKSIPDYQYKVSKILSDV